MNSSRFASSFAPYTPPPDDHSHHAESSTPSSSSKAPARPWLPVHAQSLGASTSYQSGGIPTFGTSAAGGISLGTADDPEAHINQWETTYGMRVDLLAAFAYIFGSISALVLLVMETKNDYVRFHAYQSGLLASPLILLRIFASLANFPSWLRTGFTLLMVIPLTFMAFRAHRDATQNGLTLFMIPYIGPIADRWVLEE